MNDRQSSREVCRIVILCNPAKFCFPFIKHGVQYSKGAKVRLAAWV